MPLSFITYADLGEKESMKTSAALPVIEKFDQERELGRVICRSAKNFYYQNTYSAVPVAVKYFLHGLKLIFKKFRLRFWEEIIFDFFASLKLKKSAITIIHPLFFKKTLAKAKKSGSITVGVATVIHPLCGEAIDERGDNFFPGGKVSPKQKKINREQAEIFKKYDYIIAYNEVGKRQIVEYGGISEEKVFVATPDINKKKFENVYEERKKNKNEKFIVLYIGNVRGKKGIHYLLEAWKNLKVDNKELWLVGELLLPSGVRESFFKKITENKSIKFFGFKKDVENYYEKADIFIFPSLAEGSPRVVLEAMFCGLPVITTQNAPTIIKDGKTGFIVPIQDAEAIKEKIEYLYIHQEERKVMGERAREAVLDKKPFSEEVFEIYLKIKNYKI